MDNPFPFPRLRGLCISLPSPCLIDGPETQPSFLTLIAPAVYSTIDVDQDTQGVGTLK